MKVKNIFKTPPVPYIFFTKRPNISGSQTNHLNGGICLALTIILQCQCEVFIILASLSSVISFISQSCWSGPHVFISKVLYWKPRCQSVLLFGSSFSLATNPFPDQFNIDIYKVKVNIYLYYNISILEISINVAGISFLADKRSIYIFPFISE